MYRQATEYLSAIPSLFEKESAVRRPAILLSAAVLALSGCGGSSSSGGTEATGGSAPAAAQSAAAAETPPSKVATLKDSGFGQSDNYVWVTAIVHNNSKTVGQTVTVNFNVLDDAGKILKSDSQVESFSIPLADHIIGTQIALADGQKAAKVEATVDAKADGTFSSTPFPKMPVRDMKITSEYGSYKASFELANPTTSAIKNPRIGIVCRDTKKQIIGGGSSYPDLVPGQGRIRVDADLVTSGKPASCTAFVGAPADWGDAAGAESSAPTAASGGAAAAFKAWVEQFGRKDWSAQYKTLVTAQKKTLSEKDFVAWRNSTQAPSLKWDSLTSVQDEGSVHIPGTNVSRPATKVLANLTVDGTSTPTDVQMFQEDGKWKWSLTQEAMDSVNK